MIINCLKENIMRRTVCPFTDGNLIFTAVIFRKMIWRYPLLGIYLNLCGT